MDAQDIIARMMENARRAQAEMDSFTQTQVDSIAREIAKTVYDNAEPFARMAVDETRMGVYEDKVAKNRGKARIIWNSIKGQTSIGVLQRDEATGITTVARPVGVVGAIAPCTNPVVTPMCNAMFAIKGRNAVIVAPHPRAKRTNKAVLDEVKRRIAPLGAPEYAIQYIEEPTMELSTLLMKAVDVVVATGGMGVVKAAYSSGKPAFGVGAGNVQCIVDRGVDIAKVAPKVVAGRAFDNGIICSGEQSIFLPREGYEAAVRAFAQNSCAYISNAEDVQALRRVLFPDGAMNKDLVGRSAVEAAKAAGIAVPAGTRVLLVHADGFGTADALAKEKMCPVLSAYAYDTLEQAADMAQANLNVEGRGHSISVHTISAETAEYLAGRITVCRVLVNQVCATMNGGAFTNGLTPTTTLGCGSWGNNSISENFSYRHLLNIIRIGYEVDRQAPTDDVIWS